MAEMMAAACCTHSVTTTPKQNLDTLTKTNTTRETVEAE
jgi:hypothetical protein